MLHGGISTSPTVTEVSGRGIGMDVVRDVAEQLGGEVAVHNRARPGHDRVELVVPLTLLSLNGLVVEAGGTSPTHPAGRGAATACGSARGGRDAATAAGRWPTTARSCRSCRWPGRSRSARRTRRGQPAVRVAVVVVAGDGRPSRSAWTGCSAPRPRRAAAARAGPGRAGDRRRVASTSTATRGWCWTRDGLVAAAHAGRRRVRRRPGRTEPTRRADPGRRRLADHPDAGASILESAGYEVDLAASGEEALEQGAAARVRAVPRRRRDARHGRLHVRRADPGRPGAARRAGDPGQLARLGRGPAARRARSAPARTWSRASSTRSELLGAHPGAGRVTHGMIRVLVVEDSPPCASACARSLTARPRLEVVGEATDGEPRRSSCAGAAPGRDHHGHDAAGDERARRHRAHHGAAARRRSWSCRRRPTARELFSTYDALAAGAVDVLEKPRGDDTDADWEQRLRAAVKLVVPRSG